MHEIAQIITLARATVNDPRGAARSIVALNLPQNTALLAVATVGVLTAILSSLIMPPEGASHLIFALSPIQLALVQVGGLIISAGLIRTVGSWFGGKGQLNHALAMVAWIETLMLILQIMQLFALIIFPPFAVILALAGLFLMFWLATHFIAELHGFTSLPKVFFGIIGTGLGASVVLAIVLSLTIGPIGG